MRHGFFTVAALTLALFAVGGAGVAARAEKQRFFEALYDVPVMPGLEELPEQAMLFDKPDGRIASAAAAGNAVTGADVGRFYGQTLPQMGWRKTAENQYVRKSDRLTYKIVAKPPLTIVHFTLEPADRGPLTR